MPKCLHLLKGLSVQMCETTTTDENLVVIPVKNTFNNKISKKKKKEADISIFRKNYNIWAFSYNFKHIWWFFNCNSNSQLSNVEIKHCQSFFLVSKKNNWKHILLKSAVFSKSDSFANFDEMNVSNFPYLKKVINELKMSSKD